MLVIVRLKFELTAQFLLSQKQARIQKCHNAVARSVERPSKRSQTGATQLTDVGFETRRRIRSLKIIVAKNNPSHAICVRTQR